MSLTHLVQKISRVFFEHAVHTNPYGSHKSILFIQVNSDHTNQYYERQNKLKETYGFVAQKC